MQLYVDMDGVLCDFDQHHENLIGVRPDKKTDNVDWKKVYKHGKFWRTMPPMADLKLLWEAVRPHKPIILTGVPSNPDSGVQKMEWAEEIIYPLNGGPVKVITCPSKDKSKFCEPGDLIIDDWDKYMDLWLDKGGKWILHKSAAETVEELKKMGLA
jgi:hypothetical protein